jgi:hypothetical protein
MSSSDENLRCSTPEYKKKKRGESSMGNKHRTQKYRHEWESQIQFKGWLTAAKGKKQSF